MLRGAPPATVRAALESGDSLPGTAGFAGAVDGRLVRDVLGRQPLFRDGDDWGFSPRELADPTAVPAGSVVPLGDGADDGDGRERWSLPDPEPTADRSAAVGAVRAAIRARRDDHDDPLPTAFSGGVDSAVVASLVDGPLYVAGFPGSHDVAAARSAAEWLDRPLTVVELDRGAIERIVPTIAAATGRTNPMDVAIAIPLYAVAERAAADGHDRLAVGQGADELFGGYAKVANAPEDPRVESETVRGAARELIGTLPDQLCRDVPALRDAGVEPVAPLLHDDVVAAALSLPGELLVSPAGERKYALRLAARSFVPDAVAFREKKAAQYGSLAARELDRLAREAGFKRREDDHVRRYVESL